MSNSKLLKRWLTFPNFSLYFSNQIDFLLKKKKNNVTEDFLFLWDDCLTEKMKMNFHASNLNSFYLILLFILNLHFFKQQFRFRQSFLFFLFFFFFSISFYSII